MSNIDQKGAIGGVPEIIIVIVVAILVVVTMINVGFAGYRAALVGGDIQNVLRIIEGARDAYAGWPAFDDAAGLVDDDDKTVTFLETRIIPAGMEGTGAGGAVIAQNSFGGEVRTIVQPDGLLRIEWDNVSRQVCRQLTLRTPMDVGIIAVSAGADTAPFIPVPFDPVDVDTICNEAGNTNLVRWRVQKNL